MKRPEGWQSLVEWVNIAHPGTEDEKQKAIELANGIEQNILNKLYDIHSRH